MADDIRAMAAELARDPSSLVFLALGESLRATGQLDQAESVARSGIERHANMPDARDLYARILADRGEFELAQDEWDTALRLDQRHVGAHKGLGFLAFRRGDVNSSLEHLETALGVVHRCLERRVGLPPQREQATIVCLSLLGLASRSEDLRLSQMARRKVHELRRRALE